MMAHFSRTSDPKTLIVELERVGPGFPERQLDARKMLEPQPMNGDEHWRPSGTDADAPRLK
jgi:hypothetical protein